MKDDELMGVAEVVALLGVSRQRVDELARTSKTFPAPVAQLTSGRIWRRSDVEEWARSQRGKRA